MRLVPSWPRSIDDFRPMVANSAINQLQRLAWTMQGLKVLHINATEYGGGVAELLLTQVPLMDDLGLQAHWAVIDADERFFEITKSVHNAFQGNKDVEWTKDMEQHYFETLKGNLDSMPEGYDI